jgi:hypothetical protein
MNRRIAIGLLAAGFLLIGETGQATTVTVDVKIKAVDAKARGITVIYEAKSGQKTIELDVSRKAEISVNGKAATLDTIKTGQKATVSYETDLSIVTKIEATGNPTEVDGKQPELVEVSELNEGGRNISPWLSEDGLTIYWTRWESATKINVWTAHRADPQSFFTDMKMLFKGLNPVLSPDGLELIFLNDRANGEKGYSFYVSTRDSSDKPFKRPVEVPELSKFYPGGPSLSADGLTMYFCSFSSGNDSKSSSLLYTTRKDRSSSWVEPKPVPNVKSEGGKVSGSFLTMDGLNLLVDDRRATETEERRNLMMWTRASLGKPFENGRHIDFDTLPPFFGGSPRYVAATKELFFERYFFEGKRWRPSRNSIWVVKNFTLPNVSR